MVIGVPSGIGDISWVYSKLSTVGKLEYQIADGWPYRAVDYMKLLPQVESVRYGEFEFQDIVAFQCVQERTLGEPLTWEALQRSGASRVLLQPNHHLERGHPLARWLPDLPTDYHYPIHIPVHCEAEASMLLGGVVDPARAVGITCASYRGSVAWKTWGLEEWVELCGYLTTGGWTPVFLGAVWDDLTAAVSEAVPGGVDLVGRTSFGTACAVHQKLAFFIGFSSGLGIIRSVLGLPTYMLWPVHQQALSTSWADPEDLKSLRYLATGYLSPRAVYLLFSRQVEAFR